MDDGEFTSFPEVHETSARQLIARGIKAMFPIQQHSFYPIYNREDVIARDLTGSGKTLAFCLPVTEYLRKRGHLGQGKIQAMVMCPTRELAIQVQNELAKLKHGDREFKSLTVYGGVSVEDQARQLRQGVDFFVGTCGRVLDHIERGNIDFSSLKTVILDEADQMLKQGFKEEIDKVSDFWSTREFSLLTFCFLFHIDPCRMQTLVRQGLADPTLLCHHTALGQRRSCFSHEVECQDC